MTIIRYTQLSQELYGKVITLWKKTDITNPARADSYEAIEHSLQHTGTMILALEGNEVIGTLWANHDYRRLYLHHMAVSPELQNSGIGRALLSDALQIAKSTGYQAKLEVHQDNASARHLYSSLGFKDLEGYITMIKREL